MTAPKELFLELIKPNGQPERQLKQYEALHICLDEPIGAYLHEGMLPGTTSIDRWGTTISFPAYAPGPIPLHNDNLTVCTDITKWKQTVHIPDLNLCNDDWSACSRHAEEAQAEGKLLTALMGTGIFEQCHFLMGFENTLTNLYEHPQEMHELIDAITDFRLDYARRLIDKMKPEAILSHDDWGTKTSLFMKADMWREFFKEPYRRFYGYIRSRGVITIHHADSYLVPIIDDMVEIGIQVWQGVLPENDIPALERHLNGKLTLMGGFGADIDRADAQPDEILAYAHRTLQYCCPAGHFIPCITYGIPGTIYPHVNIYLDQAIDEYNAKLHVPVPVLPPIPTRIIPDFSYCSNDSYDQPEYPSDLMQNISFAVQRGQRSRLLSFCSQALEEGYLPNDILSQGLIPGMNELGKDFSANRVFVPEMLISAKCMVAALDMLKPLMSRNSQKSIGRICLGTVKGDMHDIGKTLVKIMMEGYGIEVIDLGVDVSAETFVDTAVDNNCSIIACSSLLTTTMQEMRKIVALVEARGLHENIKIMVGGAPITQDFCDEIGADVYTVDAAEAARSAVEILRSMQS